MHTTSRHDLTAVHERLIELSELVLASIRDATAAFNTADAALAEKAVASSREVEGLADELDELAADVPTEQILSPRDVQALLCYARVTVRLARMGDFARHIAQIVQRHSPDDVAPRELQGAFVQMTAQVVDAAELVVQLVRAPDRELASELVEDDHWTDVLQGRAFAAVDAPEWAGGTARAIDVVLTARYLERFGDLAVFIAKRISALHSSERTGHVSDSAALRTP